MSEREPQNRADHLELERLRLTGARFAHHINMGTEAALNERRDIDLGTARGIAHVLGRAFGRASHLARFAREGESTYEQLRDEYLELYDQPDLSPRTREWIDWLGEHLIVRSGLSRGRLPLDQKAAPKLDQLLVRTHLPIGETVVVAHVPASRGAAAIAELAELLDQLDVSKDEALGAFLALPDVNAMDGDIMQRFDEAFAGTYRDEEAALRALSPLGDWEAELAEWRLERGIEDDALEFTTAPLIERLRTVYDLQVTQGGVHAFIK